MMNIYAFINKRIRKLYNIIFDYICKILPIKQTKIIFDNFGGKGFGDNPKYIAEEILKQKLPYDLVWVVNDLRIEVPHGIRKVLKGSKRLKYEVLTSKIRIDNVKNGLPFPKKKGQYYIQTWHANFGPKKIEREVEDKLNPKYVEESKKDSQKIDLILSGNNLFTQQIKKSFWLPETCEIFESGLPRNDIFFKYKNDDILKIKSKYRIKTNHKIALYAPTFRDDGSIKGYDLDFKNVKEVLDNKTKEKWIVIVRLHPIVIINKINIHFDNNIINGCNFEDSQELLLVADLLITDYSSMMFDFALMRKPVFIFANDLDSYSKNCRSLKPIFYELPFPHSKSKDDLLYSIVNFNFDTYIKSLNTFLNTKFISYDNGNAAERVVEWIKERIEK